MLAAFALLTGVLYNAILVDRMPPTYTIHINSTASNGLAMTGATITIEFSEPVRHDTAENAFSITPAVDHTFHWQGDVKLIVTPTAKLPLSTRFHVHMGAGVEDKPGNAQGGTGDADFTTVGRPSVVSVVPPNGALSVSVDASIEITFDRQMDPQRVLASLSLQPDINYQASWSGPLLTLKPTRPMEYGTTYTVTISSSAVDTDGTKLAPYVTTFRTASVGLRSLDLVPAPNVYGVSIHSQIAITFDGPIDPSSVGGAFTITPSVSGTTRAVSLPDDRGELGGSPAASAYAGPNVLVFTPDNPLTPHTTYTVTLGKTVKRADGQVASGQTWAFTTGEAPRNALNQIAFISHRSGVDNVWLMNPDGTNPREVTSELVPVSGYDISGDGMTIAYGAGGVVKKMSLSGDNLTTLTPGGDFEYAPTITPDGTGLIVGRRDAKGADLGYWRYPLVSGEDVKQIAPDGAPGLGSITIAAEGLTGHPGMPSWASRAALTLDGTTMLVVREADDVVEIVDITGAKEPVKLV
ncbi:MAG: Ig-like domain-containing protein, partial [Candidatus Limnocylindrales bacterium]